MPSDAQRDARLTGFAEIPVDQLHFPKVSPSKEGAATLFDVRYKYGVFAIKNGRRWMSLGRLRDGEFYPFHSLRQLPRPKRATFWFDVLLPLKANAFETVRRFGVETGVCCVCGRVLTDPISVARGIGPVCEGRWSKKEDEQAQPAFDLQALVEEHLT